MVTSNAVTNVEIGAFNETPETRRASLRDDCGFVKW
jgi:hypothetical protein